MNLVDRAKNIIVSPKTEWEVIANEQADMGGILTGYVLPMALIPFAASIIGSLIFSGSLMIGLSAGIIVLVSSVIGVAITAFVVNMLAPSFGSEQDLGRAMQLVAYGYTPSWIGGILAIIPPLAPLGMLFGLYGIYLMYLGFPHTMKTPEDKVVVYMIVTFVVMFVVYMVLALIIGLLMAGIFGAAIIGAAATM
ncbi:MAG: Yip1 family protein [Bacteroidota bacterium]